MANRISRRKIANYFATEYLNGNKKVIDQLAGFLIETKRTRELSIIIRDIEYILMQHGVIIADVTSAHQISQQVRKQIEDLASESRAKSSVHLRTSIDTSLIAGVRIETPDSVIDLSVRSKLLALKANKIY